MAEAKKSTFEVAYEEAFELASQALLKRDISECGKNAGGEVTRRSENAQTIKIKFLNKNVLIDVPAFTFSEEESSEPVHIWEKILILHYLANAEDTPLANTQINYRQVKDGTNYFSTFEKRSTKPLIGCFGEAPQTLIEAAKPLGAEAVAYGDFGIKVQAFPLVPIYFVIWKGDDEFPADGSILFDASIEKWLSAEDIAVLCQQIVFKIIRNKKS